MIDILQSLQLLQALDIQIGELESRLAQIPLEINDLEQQLIDREKVIEDKAIELEEQRKLQRKLDAELQDKEGRLVKFNVQLNQIRNNTEYRSMLKQIETIKYQNGEIESAILETYEEIDFRKKETKELKKELDIIKSKIERAVVLLRDEEKEIQLKRGELLEERKSTRADIDSNILDYYDRLKSFKLEPALVSIQEERCGGCHMNIRPKVMIEIKRNDKINYCENCSRLLFWKEPVEEKAN